MAKIQINSETILFLKIFLLEKRIFFLFYFGGVSFPNNDNRRTALIWKVLCGDGFLYVFAIITFLLS